MLESAHVRVYKYVSVCCVLLSSSVPNINIVSLSQLQLQAWNAIDEATPSEMIAKTLMNLLWFTLLARTFSTLMSQYLQLSKEWLLRVKQSQAEGWYRGIDHK